MSFETPDKPYDAGSVSVLEPAVTPDTTTSPTGQPPLPPPSVQSRASGGFRAALIGGVVGALIGGGVAVAVVKATDSDNSSTRTAPVAAAAPSGPNTQSTSAGSANGAGRLAGTGLDLRTLIDKARPSVASIETSTQQSRTVFGVGAGSGVVVSADGFVLTNNHVVQSGNVFKVTLTDGKSYDADLVGTAPSDDLALLKLKNASGLTPAVLGDSDALQVGDDVVAIGNALDLKGELTVTKGIISARDRSVPEQNGATLEGTLQTDAAINPGNSGGALFNAAGEVIGIPTAVSGQAQNIGFAIPSNRAKLVIEDLKKGGVNNPKAGFLGISAQPVSQLSSTAKTQYGITDDTGLVVTSVQKGAPADAAGITTGDVIRKIDGTEIRSQGDLGLTIRSRDPGTKISVVIERKGVSSTVEVTVGSKTATN